MPRRKQAEPKEFNIRLKFTGEMARRFNTVKQKHQFEQNTDLVRLLINNEYDQIIKQHPMEHFKTYEDHITVRDNRLGRYIDLRPQPQDGTLWCDYCKTPMCCHTTFLAQLPDVMETVKKRGWKLDR